MKNTRFRYSLYLDYSLFNCIPVLFQGDALRSSLLSRYFGANYYITISQANTKTSTDSNSKKTASQDVNSGPGAELLSRAGVTLCEMQGRLDKCGASDLIIDLIMKQPNHRVFLEILELAIALLEGGNNSIQVGVKFKRLKSRVAQSPIKLTQDQREF